MCYTSSIDIWPYERENGRNKSQIFMEYIRNMIWIYRRLWHSIVKFDDFLDAAIVSRLTLTVLCCHLFSIYSSNNLQANC